jgi:hypothetical protein
VIVATGSGGRALAGRAGRATLELIRASRVFGVVVFLGAGLVPLAAVAADVAFVAAARAGETPADRAVEARLGEPVSLYAVVVAGSGRQARYYTAASSLRVAGRLVPARQLRPWTALGAELTWALVEPYPHHVARTPPNEGNPAYANSVLFGPRHGTWLGFDTLEYHETAIEGGTGPVLVVSRATPTHPQVDVHGGLGTMRYRFSAHVPPAVGAFPAGATLAAPGAEAVGPRGILPAVMRVSFRATDGDDLVAYLTSFFNVPNLFGSAGVGGGHQTDLHQGADCADVIVGAARKMGVALAYTSVTGLFHEADAVTPPLYLTADGLFSAAPEAGGQPVRLGFGTDVRRGDLMLIDYRGVEASPRAWDHVAVVAADAGEAGAFDPHDLVQHMGYLYGLAQEPAASQAPAIIQFLRWKPRVARALTRAARGVVSASAPPAIDPGTQPGTNRR